MEAVRLATSRIAPADVPAGRLATADARLETGAISWARFGDEVTYYGADRDWGRFTETADRTGTALRERPGTVDRERLHVVVQKGRLFQQEHPEIPVLLDKGRFLLVDMDRERARRIGDTDVPCFSVRPLGELDASGADGVNRVVFTAQGRAGPPAAADAAVQALVDNVSRATFEAVLAHLVGLRTRHSAAPEYTAACAFAAQQLTSMGYATTREAISVNGAPSENVVARRDGSGPTPRGLLLVTAHLDSINLQGNAASPAPGADDDGSGSAGVIEIARALKDHCGAHDLQFVLFGGEEQGLFGSKQFVDAMALADRERVRAVVQMDMIGSLNAPVPTVLLEGAARSREIIDGLSAAAVTYTGLAVQTSLNPFNSDHVSFLRAGIPAVLTIEGTDEANTAVHSAGDTLDRINFDLAIDILRMNTAFVAAAVGRA
jgi:Peptidase family M28